MRKISWLGQAIVVVIMLCLGWVSASQMSAEELSFPGGTRYSTWVDTTGIKQPKQQVLTDITAMADAKHSPIIYTYVASMTNDNIDLVVFGNDGRTGSQVSWFSPSRHGRWCSPDALEQASLNGTYSFYDESAAREFQQWIVDHGGESGAIVVKPRNMLMQSLLANSGMASAVAALATLLIAISWTQSCGDYQTRSIRIMSGVLPRTVFKQDLLIDLRRICLSSGIGMGVVLLLVAIHHGSASNLGEFAMLNLEGALGVIATFMAASALCLACIHPRAREIAARTMPFRRIRWGNMALIAMTVFVSVTTMTLSAGNAQQYRHRVDDLNVWQSLDQLAEAQMNVSVGDEYLKEHGTQVQQAFEDLDRSHAMALSMSVALFFTPSNGEMPSQSQISAAVAPFDDVVICNHELLSLFQVSMSDMQRIHVDELPSNLQNDLEAYDALWLNDEAPRMTTELYTWKGERSFPSIQYGALSGSLNESKNPLIIVVDDISQNLNLEGMLIPAFSTGNLVFSNAQTALQAFASHGVGDFIVSTSTIADTVYRQVIELREMLIACLSACFISFVGLMLMLAFAARSWSEENREFIVLRHVAGASFSKIIARRTLLLDGVLLLMIMITLLITRTMIQAEMPLGETVLLVAMLTVAALLGNWLCMWQSARQKFTGEIMRR